MRGNSAIGPFAFQKCSLQYLLQSAVEASWRSGPPVALRGRVEAPRESKAEQHIAKEPNAYTNNTLPFLEVLAQELAQAKAASHI